MACRVLGRERERERVDELGAGGQITDTKKLLFGMRARDRARGWWRRQQMMAWPQRLPTALLSRAQPVWPLGSPIAASQIRRPIFAHVLMFWERRQHKKQARNAARRSRILDISVLCPTIYTAPPAKPNARSAMQQKSKSRTAGKRNSKS